MLVKILNGAGYNLSASIGEAVEADRCWNDTYEIKGSELIAAGESDGTFDPEFKYCFLDNEVLPIIGDKQVFKYGFASNGDFILSNGAKYAVFSPLSADEILESRQDFIAMFDALSHLKADELDEYGVNDIEWSPL